MRNEYKMNPRFKILIVEDEIITGMMLREELKRNRFSTIELVTTGENAIKSVKKNPPDLILMDILLAGKLNGVDIIKEIQAFCNIPVIFMTGFDDKETKSTALNLKPLGFFNKPILINELLNTIHPLAYPPC
jgi:DNA-binding response OmpR family regulator